MTLVWQEGINGPLEEDNLPALDPRDPQTYYTEVVFPPPLPLDKEETNTFSSLYVR